jgi:hypothetical protein
MARIVKLPASGGIVTIGDKISVTVSDGGRRVVVVAPGLIVKQHRLAKSGEKVDKKEK